MGRGRSGVCEFNIRKKTGVVVKEWYVKKREREVFVTQELIEILEASEKML